MRINQYLSAAGHCSRRQADRLIQEGKVKINGRRAVLGQSVKETDTVMVERQRIRLPQKKYYIAFHKPAGVVSTSDPKVKNNIIDYIGFHERIFTIGRLDKDSEGLILLTSDGDVVNRVLRAEKEHQKEYHVTVDRMISDKDIKTLQAGVTIFNPVQKKHVKVAAKIIERQGDRSFRIVLTQGLNRQIRRMCEALGYQVTTLKRVRIMHVHLGKLKAGSYRHLSKEEMKGLFT